MNKLVYVTVDEVKKLILAGNKSFAVIDLRDDDYIRGNIKNSMHIPSRTFNTTRAKQLADELIKKNVDNVIFHCHFSQQRGPTGASLFTEVIEREYPTAKMQM
jgi:rhodanese-related sulfurtransferase